MRPAYSGRSATTARFRRVLVGPVTVLVEEAAGFLLAITERVSAHRDLRQESEQERSKAGADDPEPAMKRRPLGLDDDQDQPGEREGGRQDVTDDEEGAPVLLLLVHDPFSAPSTRSSCSAGFTLRK